MDGELKIIRKSTGESLLPLFSSRNCTETLKFSTKANTRRNMKGELVDISYFKGLLYNSIITGEDIRPPLIQDYIRGEILILESSQRITIPTLSKQTIDLDKLPVKNSVLLHKSDGTLLEAKVDNKKVLIENSETISFVSYRPLMNMLTTGFSVTHDEKKGTYQWCLELEEV